MQIISAFLSGIAYIIAGILGIVASRCSTTSNITIFLVLNIIALPFAAFQLTTSLRLLALHSQVGYIILYVALTIIAFIEGVTAYICTVLCCRTWGDIFAEKTSKIAGIIQIALGIVTCACCIWLYTYYNLVYKHYEFFISVPEEGSLYSTLPIFVGGIFFIIAGILASRKSTNLAKSRLTACLVLSIIAYLYAAYLAYFSIAYLSTQAWAYYEDGPTMQWLVPYIFLAIAALVEGVASIICSSVCYVSLCAERFAEKLSKNLSVPQIVLGFVTLSCYIGPIVYSHIAYDSPNYEFDIKHVPAFLGGIAYIIAGILGIEASRCSTTRNINALPFAALQLTTSLAAVVVFLQSPVAVVYIMLSIALAISASIEGVLTLVCSCQCCAAYGYGSASRGQVLYAPVDGVGGRLMPVNVHTANTDERRSNGERMDYVLVIIIICVYFKFNIW